MQANLGLMFERKAKISCNGGRSVTKNLRAKKDAEVSESRLPSEKRDFAGLKITFVDMTYPSQRPDLPSLFRHFLLTRPNVCRMY